MINSIKNETMWSHTILHMDYDTVNTNFWQSNTAGNETCRKIRFSGSAIKRLLLLVFVLSLNLFAMSQNNQKHSETYYETQWNALDSLLEKSSFNSAYAQAQKIFTFAQKEKNSHAILTGAFYVSRAEAANRENARDSVLNRFLSILPMLEPSDGAMCHAFIAQFYNDYREGNRWQINANKETDETNLNYTLWPSARFDTAIHQHLRLALRDPSTLKALKVEAYKHLLTASVSPQERKGRPNMTPTLFDVIMGIAQDCVEDGREKIDIQKQLIAFHANDDDAIRITLDDNFLEQLDMLPSQQHSAAYPEVTPLLMDSYLQKYKGTASDLVTGLYYRKAQKYFSGVWNLFLDKSTDNLLAAMEVCQQGYNLFPKSEGGAQCYDLMQSIKAPQIEEKLSENQLSDRSMLAFATVKNVDTVYFRVISWFDIGAPDDCKVMATQKALKDWCQVVPQRNDYQSQNIYSYLPAMPAGHYFLLASNDRTFQKKVLVYNEFTCVNADFVKIGYRGDSSIYCLLNTATGKGIANAGVEVRVVDRYNDKNSNKLILTTKTDKDGNIVLNKNTIKDYRQDMELRTIYDGVKVTRRITFLNNRERQRDTTLNIFTDRPVYKPGEVVSFMVLCYDYDGKTTAHVLPGEKVFVELLDVNWDQRDTLHLVSDNYGQLHGTFTLPADAMPGSWVLSINNSWKYIEVQYYKQPKFVVALPTDNDPHAFGKELTVSGTAISYTEVPVTDAKVEYTVKRQQMMPFWRWWWLGHVESQETNVTNGETTTGADGSFHFAFVPQPDSSIDLSDKPCFNYTITTKVTDVNGESHEQSRVINIGYENSYVLINNATNVRNLDEVRYCYRNLDGKALEGTMQVTVEELQQPQKPLFVAHDDDAYYNCKANCRHTMSREEFEQRYPYYAYDDKEVTPLYLLTKRVVLTTSQQADKEKQENVMRLKAQPSGLYRITVSTKDSEGNMVSNSQVVVVTGAEEKQCQSTNLLWYDIKNDTVDVGDTLQLRVGTRFKDVNVIYALSTNINGKMKDYRQISLSDEVKTLLIPVTEDMKGDFSVELFAMRENEVAEEHISVTVPYHKNLKLFFTTFRDKLQPGNRETWTIAVQNDSGEDSRDANVLMTMYDAALDTYGDIGWRINAGANSLWCHYGLFSNMVLADRNNQESQYCNFNTSTRMDGNVGNSITPYNWNLYKIEFGNYWIAYCCNSSNSRGMKRNSALQIKNEQEIIEDLNVVDDGAEAKYNKTGIAEIPMAQNKAAVQEQPPVQVRENMNTLAFFEPQMRTDNNGNVSLTFQVPELLTQWHIEGFAHTKDMRVGWLTAKAVTTKELMVVPNVPRFLRQGDQIDFMVKVSNTTDRLQEVALSLEMNDAATGKTVCMITPSDRQDEEQGRVTENLTVDAKSSKSVTFHLRVPDKDLFAVTYRVVALGTGSSDGEQAIIPVVTNRTLVTESMAMYVNGQEEKHYTMNNLKNYTSSTLQHQSLSVEVTANPIWYAIQSLPYVEEHKNPSNIYLINSIYTNALASYILHQSPQIEKTFQQWSNIEPEALTGKLEQNQEIKQTILQETPWLKDGTDETDRMRRIGLFFNEKTLKKTLDDAYVKLEAGQTANGAWSWIPGGRWESEYITSYILKTYGHLYRVMGDDTPNKVFHNGRPSNNMLNKALGFVDNENYKFYQECLKHNTWKPSNIDYLYMRSFYPNAGIAGEVKKSYEFFYHNALNNYKNYTGLYTQAQLALIFQRHGDTQAAKDLLRRLKESSLTNDEMGMYWRDNVSGYFWNERPIEVQSLLIEAFDEVAPDDKESVAKMRQWLLKQKQTTSWNSDVATVNAVQALMSGAPSLSDSVAQSVTVTVGGIPLSAPKQSGTGYQQQRWSGDSISREQSDVVIRKSTDGIAWGAMYWQYFEDMDKVPYSEMGIKMEKSLYRVNKEGDMSLVNDTTHLKVGDKVKVRILIDCDRNLEYLELKDSRTAAFEPISTQSGWKWDDGLSYYVAVYDASTRFFIDRLDKGKYVLEYDMFVNGSGEKLSLGNATMQCMYAPEFRCNTQGMTLKVEP